MNRPAAVPAANVAQLDFDRLDFVPLKDAAHIAPYHDIRRIELFERYDPHIRYHPGIADEDAPNHLGHVLLLDREVVGTMRIDLIDRQRAGLRLVAIKGAKENLITCNR